MPYLSDRTGIFHTVSIISPFTIGRGAGCSWQLVDGSVSRRHAIITKSETESDGWEIVNESETNPVRLNGEALFCRSKLKDGDDIQLGDVRLIFTLEAPVRQVEPTVRGGTTEPTKRLLNGREPMVSGEIPDGQVGQVIQFIANGSNPGRLLLHGGAPDLEIVIAGKIILSMTCGKLRDCEVIPSLSLRSYKRFSFWTEVVTGQILMDVQGLLLEVARIQDETRRVSKRR